MTSNNKKSQSNPVGDIFLPIFDLLTILSQKIIEVTIKLIQFTLDKYVFKREQELKKIERVDLTINKTTKNDDSFGFSITQKRDIESKEIDFKAHSAIVGASGTGKSSLLDTLIFSDLKAKKTVLFIDPKSTKAGLEQFVNLCKYNSRNYKLFSNSYKGENKLYINPVKQGSVTQITDRIFKAFNWSEEFYALKCYQALRISISELKRKKETITLSKIEGTIKMIAESKDQRFKRVSLNEVDGIITKLENINQSDFGELINHPRGYSFTELRKKNINSYIGISVLGYPEIARAIGKLFLGDIATSVDQVYQEVGIEDDLNLRPISLKIDELGAIILDEFVEILNKCRGAKLELTVAMQTPNDIDKVDANLTQQVFENTSNWFIMRQRMKESASMLSESIGTMESTKQTIRIDEGEEQDQGSQRKVEELIVHTNIIKSLKRGQCILMSQDPFKVDLVNVKYINPLDVLSNLRLMNIGGQPIQKEKQNPKKMKFVEAK